MSKARWSALAYSRAWAGLILVDPYGVSPCRGFRSPKIRQARALFDFLVLYLPFTSRQPPRPAHSRRIQNRGWAAHHVC